MTIIYVYYYRQGDAGGGPGLAAWLLDRTAACLAKKNKRHTTQRFALGFYYVLYDTQMNLHIIQNNDCMFYKEISKSKSRLLS